MRSEAELKTAIYNLQALCASINNIVCPIERQAASAQLAQSTAELEVLKWALQDTYPATESALEFVHHVQQVDGLTNCDFLLLERTEGDSEVLASCRVEQWNLPGGWISWVHVPAPHRRHGFAFQLLAYVLHAARAAGKEGLTLTVKSANTAAQALYRKLEFRAVGAPHYDLGNILMTHHFAPLVQKGEPTNG